MRPLWQRGSFSASFSQRSSLRKFREAIQPLLLPPSNSNSNDLRFDMAKLKINPYVRGLWNEALRLGSASAAARVVSKDTELDGYSLKRGGRCPATCSPPAS